MKDIVVQHLEEARAGLENLLSNPEVLDRILAASQMIVQQIQDGKKVISCGNGGSMCDAMHFAEELSGRYRNDRPSYPALSISDPSHISCVANDYGYEEVFARYIEGLGNAGDVLVGFSTSGGSKNVVRGAQTARAKGMHVIVLTGREDSVLGEIADIEICTPAGKFADRVQELHIKIVHILIDLIERQLVGN